MACLKGRRKTFRKTNYFSLCRLPRSYNKQKQEVINPALLLRRLGKAVLGFRKDSGIFNKGIFVYCFIKTCNAHASEYNGF